MPESLEKITKRLDTYIRMLNALNPESERWREIKDKLLESLDRNSKILGRHLKKYERAYYNAGENYKKLVA